MADLVFNEELHTQWARVELYGDVGAAKEYIPRARGVLGQMLVEHGVNEARARGEGGGFFHRTKILPDGARIQALTNDGHHTVRIFPPPVPGEEAPVRRDDGTKPGDYLWIGVRVKDGCTRPWYALDVAVLEPASEARGIVATGFATLNNWIADVDVTNTGTPDAPQYRLDDADGADGVGMIQAMYNTWYSGTPPFSSTMTLGDHNFIANVSDVPGGFDADNFTRVGFTVHGLMGMYWGGDSQPDWGPYDPEMSIQQNAGSDRTFAGRNDTIGGAPPAWNYGWDFVAWVDPDDSDLAGTDPTLEMDDRPRTLALKDLLRQKNFFTNEQLLPGKYLVVCRAYDAAPTLASTRANQPIPNSGGLTVSASCDFDNYMQMTASWPPLELEVEVRIGRMTLIKRDGVPDPDEIRTNIPSQVFNFDLTCDSYDQRYAVVYPHGSSTTYDDCLNDNGPNMGGPSFSQVIAIDAQGGTAEIAGDVSLMAPFFAAGTYHAPITDQRRNCRFFIGTAFPDPSSGAWANLAGTSLYTAINSVTSGNYGCCKLGDDISEAQFQAMFAGTDLSHVWSWAPGESGVRDEGPPKGSPSDWTYHSPPFDSTNFYWYYTLAVPYQNVCIRTYGIAVTSTGGFYEMTQNFVGATGFTQPNCC